MTRVNFSDLEKIRAAHQHQKIVFCSGCFDLTHAGHVLFFEDCKKQGDILVVMVGSDKVVARDKGAQRPILNEHLRIKLIDSLKPVDYTFFDDLVPKTAHPLEYINTVLTKLRPNIYVVNEDAWDMDYRKKTTERLGVELVQLERWCPEEFEKISTTKIIEKIKNTT